jgi:hypothetical protein
MGLRSPAPHPEPPSDLHVRPLPMRQARGPWIRLHACRRSARFFGKTRLHRFDAPAGEYGILYAGEDDFCAFVETLGDPLDVRVVSRADLLQSCLSTVTPGRPLRLVDLTAQGLSRVGADNRLPAGDDYALSQRWGRALWAHPEHADGLVYRARHDPSKESVAIFDRAGSALRLRRLRKLVDDSARLAEILDRYGFALVE